MKSVNTVATGETQVVSASSALILTVKLVELVCSLMFGGCKTEGRQKRRKMMMLREGSTNGG